MARPQDHLSRTMTTAQTYLSILDCSQQMVAALRKLDLTRFEELLLVREELTEMLEEEGAIAPPAPRRPVVEAAIRRQQLMIRTEVDRCRTALAASLASADGMSLKSGFVRSSRRAA